MFVELKAEIDRLRSQSGVMNEEQQSASLAEITALKEKLAVREKEMEEMTRYSVGVNLLIFQCRCYFKLLIFLKIVLPF